MSSVLSFSETIQSTKLSVSTCSHLNGRVPRLPCHQLHRVKTHYKSHIVHLFLRQQKGTSTLSQRSLVFATPNEGGKFERGGSPFCSDDPVFLASGDLDTSEKDPLVEIASSRLSEESPSENSTIYGIQADILDKLKTIYLHLLASEQWNSATLQKCDRTYLVSGTNLIHYLALKSLDIEPLLEELLSIGLLNLNSITPYVLPGLTACIQTLESSSSNSQNGKAKQSTTIKLNNRDLSIGNMRKQLSHNRERLFGPLQNRRTTHIMVTLGEEALHSQSLVPNILTSGATIVRINCAHGNPTIWSEIITRVRHSSQMLEKPCRILMDLAGPKLRTDMLHESPCVIKVSPKKNTTGHVSYPAQVWLSCKGTEPPAHLSPDAVIYVDNPEFFRNLEVDDVIKFCDARGKQRKLKVSLKPSSTHTGVICECRKTAYIISGTELYAPRKGKGKREKGCIGVVVDVPPADHFIRVKEGDLLIISRETQFSPTKGVHRIKCSSGYLFDSVKPGETISFDDGKIWGVIQGTSDSEIIVSISHAGVKGTKLRSEKSINIPDSSIRFEGLTSKDLIDLEFVASHADMVGVSFIRDVRDVAVLHKELKKLKDRNLGVVLKIETKGGFEKLPLLLLEAMKCSNPLGVMIARGDLAVEGGWENLGNMQEEILSTCNAAHVPVIWATQVLESLVKSGVPSRAELTDVASGRRASCIMLNKGKNIREAVVMLDSILKNSSPRVDATPKLAHRNISPL